MFGSTSDQFGRADTSMDLPSVGSLSNQQLVQKLIGVRQTRKFYRGTLQSLFTGSETGPANERCAVARELVMRTIREDLKVKDSLSSPQAVRDFLRLMMVGKEHEVFVVLFLDAQHRVIASEEMFRGTLTQTSVYPREVVKAALRHNAAALIFAHNHPSGVAEPSHADEMITRALKSALALVDVQVLDHFIVAGGKTLSFAERGLL